MVDEDHSSSLIAEGGIFIALSTLAIVLRFWSRSLLPSHKFQADDWTALAAYPFVISALAVIVAWAENGLGQHAVALSPEALRLIITKKLVWNTGVSLSRISVLLFYRRLFDNAKSFRVLFWLGIGFNIAWWTMLFFFVMFGCHPVQRQWDTALPGICMQELPGQILSSLTSFILDVYILVIPFPLLMRLQMAWSRKIVVAFIFVVGYSVPLLSLGRLIVTVKNKEAINDDPNWGYGLQEPWSMCEIAIAFIGVTMPGIWTLVRRGMLYGPSALFTDKNFASQERSEKRLSTMSKVETSSTEPNSEKPYIMQDSSHGGQEESWMNLRSSYWDPSVSTYWNPEASTTRGEDEPAEQPDSPYAMHEEYSTLDSPQPVVQKGYWSPEEADTPDRKRNTRRLIARSIQSAYKY